MFWGQVGGLYQELLRLIVGAPFGKARLKFTLVIKRLGNDEGDAQSRPGKIPLHKFRKRTTGAESRTSAGSADLRHMNGITSIEKLVGDVHHPSRSRERALSVPAGTTRRAPSTPASRGQCLLGRDRCWLWLVRGAAAVVAEQSTRRAPRP